MKITPALGIGDLLLLKMYVNTNNINIDTIIISTKLIKEYRNYPEKMKLFNVNFINNLFHNIKIEFSDDDYKLFYPPNYSFSTTYLFDFYKFKSQNNLKYENYIFFHTKCRFDSCSKAFLSEINYLSKFFENYKSKYKILILGERKIEQNKEAILHKIISIYDKILLLKNNNEVIDLTYEELYSCNNYSDFEQDLYIINNAKLNIGFGYGGPLTICQAFSHNNLFYINKLNHECLKTYKKLNNSVCDNIDNFIKKLNNFV
jgi:hypothetical protein